MNTLRASRQSEYRRVKTRKQKYLAGRRAARRVSPTHSSKANYILARLNTVRRAIAALPGDNTSTGRTPTLGALQAYANYLVQQAQADAQLSRSQTRTATPGAVARTTLKVVRAPSSARRRAAAAAQVQSTQRTVDAERALMA
jgi:hypothetical protein